MQTSNQNHLISYQIIFIIFISLSFCEQKVSAQSRNTYWETKELLEEDKRMTKWIPYRKGNDWYFVDPQGEKVLDAPDYEIVYPFTSGLAMIFKEGCYGFIDKTGEIVIPCQLEDPHEVLYFKKNLQYLLIQKVAFINVGTKGGSTQIDEHAPFMGYNRSQKTLSDYYALYANDYSTSSLIQISSSLRNNKYKTPELFKVKQENGWGILNENFNKIIPTNYEELYFLEDSLFLVKSNQKYSLIDINNKVLKTYSNFDNLKRRSNGFLIKKDSMFGFINLEGNISIPIEMDEIKSSEKGFILFKNGKYKWANLEGEVLTPLGYDESYHNSLGKIVFVRNEDKFYKIIQEENDVKMIPTKYSAIKKLEDDYWLVSQKKKKGIYKNNEIVHPKYDAIEIRTIEKNGPPFFFVKQKNKWGVLDNNGDSFTDISYDYISPIFDIKADKQIVISKSYPLLRANALSWKNTAVLYAKTKNKWGLLNKDGTDNKTIQYDQIQSLFYHKLFSVQKDKKWGVIDNKGKVIIPITESFAPSLKGQETTRGFFIKLGLKEGLRCFYLEKIFTDEPIDRRAQGPSFGQEEINLNNKYHLKLSTEIPDNTPCTCNAEIKEHATLPNNTGATGPQGPPRYYLPYRNPMTAATSLLASDSVQLKDLLTLQNSTSIGAAPDGDFNKALEQKYVPQYFQEIRGIKGSELFAKIDGKWGYFNHQLNHFILYPTYDNIFVDFRMHKPKIAKKDGKWWVLNDCGEIEKPYSEIKIPKETKLYSYFINETENNQKS